MSDQPVHTRTRHPAGPDFCAECSEAVKEWIQWPCSPQKVAQIARADALEAAADEWQWDMWAKAPRRADIVEERMATANFVTTWLRNLVALARQETNDGQ